MTAEAVLLRPFSQRFEVLTSGGVRLLCSVRGRVSRSERLLAGDRVEVQQTGEGEGVIERLLPRKNRLSRPPVANADTLLAVFSLRQPAVPLLQVDGLLVTAAEIGATAVLVLTKADLLAAGEGEEVLAVYRAAGFATVAGSCLDAAVVTALRSCLRGVTVLAGPSGVGKSTLLNALLPDVHEETGPVSAKIERGRHTTRWTRLHPLPMGGFLADTPGYSAPPLPSGLDAIAAAYPEFEPLRQHCRFPACRHMSEPDCAVREAAQEGRIAQWRLAHYLELARSLRPVHG